MLAAPIKTRVSQVWGFLGGSDINLFGAQHSPGPSPTLSHGTQWARRTNENRELILPAVLVVTKSLVQAFCAFGKQPSNFARPTD